ncbi:transcriptional regulator, ArsR family [Vibrio xiamenensis]|uniref:Transcriptional regulator, ArsR family n=2 Tax=Vibrio xiamenensis TaxID=861298 RepID=A0A1G7YYE5_9VIBR|nr:transcriptional regulator, ArsR family [Vibrio xiamenensis]
MYADSMTPLVVFKSLSEDTRLKIMMLLTIHPELCVCDLQQSLALSQPKISRHLAELRRHQLLEDERRGKWVYYRLHRGLEPWVIQVLKTTSADNQAYMKACLQRLLKPCEQCES